MAAIRRLVPLLIWLRLAAGDDAALPDWQPFETEFGRIQVRELGPHNGPLVLLIHGMMDNDFIHNEWNPVALRLAALGYHVLMPNFHSGPEGLRPGKLTGETLRQLISGSISEANSMIPARYRTVVKPRLSVMGKSWGARMASEAGALSEVVAVGLVVPALGSDAPRLLPAIQGSITMCLVEDDPVVNFVEASETLRTAAAKEVGWHVAKVGGHRVLPDFVDPLVDFIEANRDRYEVAASEL